MPIQSASFRQFATYFITIGYLIFRHHKFINISMQLEAKLYILLFDSTGFFEEKMMDFSGV